jgi:hypothetical protein
MAEDTIDRVALLKEAAEIEAAGGEWKMRHVAAVVDCARSTVYNTPWLLAIARRVGKRGLRWLPAEVRARKRLTDSPTAYARPRRTGT